MKEKSENTTKNLNQSKMKTVTEWLYRKLNEGSLTSYIVLKEQEEILKKAKEMEEIEKIKAQMECLNRAKDLDIQTVYNELKQELETFKSE
jgi:hypothetical protein